MEKWYVAAKKADFNQWAADFHITPVLARILRNRDLTEEQEIEKYLHGSLADCYAPGLMKDMNRAVELILQAVQEEKAIRIIGDYDVDGICSAYILTSGLKALGANVDTAIPHRIHDGYGLNDHLIELAREDGIQLLITCDNGIAAASQIRLAASYHMGVIVTDHHEVPFVEEDGLRRELLPPALAVVDPKQADCPYPYKNICGAVVAYKLIQALGEELERREATDISGAEQRGAAGDSGAERQEAAGISGAEQCGAALQSPGERTVGRSAGAGRAARLRACMEEFLELAALATVCDVMELKDENRILVKEGLKRLKKTKNCGLQALMEVNGLEPEKLSSYHLGFVLGPCLNATGRLDTAVRALELLQSTSRGEAMTVARELKELNDSRKNMTAEGVQQAEDYIAAKHLEQDPVMLIFLPQVHESLAGIIAGRIREKYHHPVFVLTRSEEGVKGSGRSIGAYHMYNAMTRVKHFFTKYGGHALAAGLSMREEDLEALRQALNETSGLSFEDFIPQVHIDVPMPLSYASEKLADELTLLEPFGVGNPHPLFAQKELVFLAGTRMGANKNFARFRVRTPEGTQHQLVYFGDLERFEAFLREKYGPDSERALYGGRGNFALSVVYQLSKNTYRGQTSLQFVMTNYC